MFLWKKLLWCIVALSFAIVLVWCATWWEKKDSVQTAQAWTTKIAIETSYGTMEAVLYDSTPGHRDNFIKLVEEWFYDDLLFHRVIQWFMIQWGDPESRDAPITKRLWTWWPGYQIDEEIGAYHFKWTLAAARTWDAVNPERKSSGSQFYIVQWQKQTQEALNTFALQKWISYTQEEVQKYMDIWWTPMLDNDYTVFGEVTMWMDIIDAIAAVDTVPGDRPVKDVSMKITVIE